MRAIRAAMALLGMSVGLAAAASARAAPAATCAMAASDARWIAGALANWRHAERRLLRLSPASLPQVIVFDATCTFTAAPGGGASPRWRAAAHGGKPTPGGRPLPLGPISFAAPPERGVPGFFVMSLPSLWRAGGVKSGLGLEVLMDGVLLHEMMHTRQFYFATPALAALEKKGGFGDELNDDALQERFKADPTYVAAWQAERDRLLAAAAAPDDAAARRLAGEALAMMRARRARWFAGAAAHWRDADDIFLTMEGLGQWVAYAWYRSPGGGAVPAATVLTEMRRGGLYWTQDEGLALFLVVDRLVPGWQRLAFAKRPLLAEALLASAAGEGISARE